MTVKVGVVGAAPVLGFAAAKQHPNRLAQIVRDHSLRGPIGTDSLLASLGTRIWGLVERIVLRFGDPLVQWRLGPFALRLQLSHRLPSHFTYWPHYNRNLGRIAKVLYDCQPDLRAVDVGANVGDSVAVVRADAEFPVLCVEPDPRFFDLLKRNTAQFRDVVLVQEYLGEGPAEVAGRLSLAGGTGHLEAGAPQDETIQIRTLCDVLSEHPEFAGAKLVKIDTDGYDCKILRGAAPWLARSKPVLFFEYDPYFLSLQSDDGLSVFATLKQLGYSDLLIYDNVGKLISSERLDEDAALSRMHYEYCDGQRGGLYVDLCVFHGEDSELFAAALAAETEYFRAADRHAL